MKINIEYNIDIEYNIELIEKRIVLDNFSDI